MIIKNTQESEKWKIFIASYAECAKLNIPDDTEVIFCDDVKRALAQYINSDTSELKQYNRSVPTHGSVLLRNELIKHHVVFSTLVGRIKINAFATLLHELRHVHDWEELLRFMPKAYSEYFNTTKEFLLFKLGSEFYARQHGVIYSVLLNNHFEPEHSVSINDLYADIMNGNKLMSNPDENLPNETLYTISGTLGMIDGLGKLLKRDLAHELISNKYLLDYYETLVMTPNMTSLFDRQDEFWVVANAIIDHFGATLG